MRTLLQKIYKTKSMKTKRFHWKVALAFFLGGIIVITGIHVYIYFHAQNASFTQSQDAFISQRNTFSVQELQDALLLFEGRGADEENVDQNSDAESIDGE